MAIPGPGDEHPEIPAFFSCSPCIQPICSMYGIFTYIWMIFRANVGKYSIHGAYGQGFDSYPYIYI